MTSSGLDPTHVLVLDCGGTINMSRGLGARPADAIRGALRELRSAPPFEVVSVFGRGPDSSNVGEREWTEISLALRTMDAARAAAARAAGEPRPAGIVVTHGTDTMQLTALFLALETAYVDLSAPVILTGSHTPPGEGSDAAHNLARSLFVAAARGVDAQLPPGVYVLIGREIHLATRITKVSTEPDADGRYFSSFPEPIARVTLAREGRTPPVRLMVDRRFLETIRPTAERPARVRPLGRVEHALLDRACGPEALLSRLARLRAEAGPAGIVVQGNFVGNPNFPEMAAGLVGFAETRGYVVVGSRRVWEELARHPRVLLLPKSLSHSAGWLKLAWLFGTDADPAVWLGENVAGEIFVCEDLPEWINYETFPGQLPGREIVITTPDLPAAALSDAMERLRGHTNATLVLYGFGHGHIPSGNEPVDVRVARFVEPFGLDGGVLAGLGAEELVAALQRDPAWHTLGPVLEERYTVRRGELRGVLFRSLAEAWSRSERAALRTDLRARLGAALEGTFAASRADELAGLLAADAPIRADPAALRAQVDARLGAFDKASSPAWLLTTVPDLVARRLVKDAVMASSARHAALGRGVDAGVQVEIRTLAMRGQTDCGRYEVGNLLLAVGADSERTPGWRTRALQPRSA